MVVHRVMCVYALMDRCICVFHAEISSVELGHAAVEAGSHLNVNLIPDSLPGHQDNV